MMDEKQKDRSFNVKVRDGWFCKKCGELDRELLEVPHCVPVGVDPSLTYGYDDRNCSCLWCLAHEHRRGAVRDKILARLAVILYKRLRPNICLHKAHYVRT
ncbi:MAG: hypothetical protein ACYTBJ_12930 [Planctomycetota bacterium]|jgi:hypothetical protein